MYGALKTLGFLVCTGRAGASDAADPSIFEKIQVLCTVLRKWLPAYWLGRLQGRPKPAHVIFCMVDHYEPGTGMVSAEIERARMRDLLSRYPVLADKHRDANGHRPTRTWFFPPHYHRRENLRQLVELCAAGYGEIELHLHHGKTVPDTPENLEETLRRCVAEYSHFGIFGSETGVKRYGFIHGDWALDNSRGGRYCGVNNEITILRQTGCYADFTFPAPNRASPSQINTIYYALDNPTRPKSHDRGVLVRNGAVANGDLLVVQGPLHPVFLEGRFGALRAMTDAVSPSHPPWKKRVDLWVKTWIHVAGKQDWVFVKVHTHGATDAEVVLGSAMDEAFSHLEQVYNDADNYVLHYVTAHELYNVVKAAEAGETGDPGRYRDYKVGQPNYDSKCAIPEASAELKDCISRTYQG